MLIEFSVANFRSIRERVTLSMMATDEEGLEGNVIQPHGLLKSTVIYGANASGKSNVLKALEFMIQFVRESHRVQRGDLIPVSPFRLDVAFEKHPSEFEIFFLKDGIKYAYGFKVDIEKVHEEYLYEYLDEKQSLIFERTCSDFEFGVDQQEQAVLSKRTLENTLYLAIATQFNYEKAFQVYEWIKSCVELWITDLVSDGASRTNELLLNDMEAHELIKNFLMNADTGIHDIKIFGDSTDDVKRVPIKLSEKQQKTRIALEYLDVFALGQRKPLNLKTKNIRFSHFYVDDAGKAGSSLFRLSDESEGTQKLYRLIGSWIDVLRKGSLLIVDELETSLHANIVEQLIKLFQDPEHNPNGAQLVFTAHNTNLLNSAIFRRDQIWFTEKVQEKGSTTLYSLAEFTPRESEDIEKGYLLGRYGAIPFLGKEFLF